MSEVQVLVAGSADDLADSVAAMLATRIVERQADVGGAHIVLTGGGIGTSILERLRRPLTADAIDWSAIDIWWGDERYLPTGDPERNETGARAVLLDHVGVDPSRIHPMAGPDQSTDAEDSALQYAATLKRHAGPGAPVPTFDVLLLGIGPDGHIASLFPELAGVHEQQATVVAVHGSPKPPPTRVSLTFPAVTAAREVWIVASGTSKAEAVRLMLDPAAGPLQIPAAGAHGLQRTLLLLDPEAAASLPTTLHRPLA